MNKISGANEWGASKENIMFGCQHDCHYCLDGNTLIMMANGLTKNIKDIEIGDLIYGVKKDGVYWKYIVSEVTNKWKTRKTSYKITLENGTELISSADHRWLANRGGWKYVKGEMSGNNRRPYLTTNNTLRGFGNSTDTNKYKETDLYKKGYLSGMINGDGSLGIYDYSGKRGRKDVQYRFKLAIIDIEGIERTEKYLKYFGIDVKRYITPMKRRNGNIENFVSIRTNKKSNYYLIKKLISHKKQKEFLRGYLAGIFDAEGNGSGVNRNIKRISNTDEKIISMIESGMKIYSFHSVFDKDQIRPSGKILRTIRIKGGHREFIRFFQITQPAIKRHFDISGGSVKTFSGTKIISIKKHRKNQELYDITTTSENFIANGLISHNCYAKAMSPRHKKIDLEHWADPIIRHDKLAKSIGKRKGTIMFPTTHDLHPDNLQYIIPFIKKLLSPGNKVLIVTKPHLRVIKTICWNFENRKDQILFRFTMGSAFDEILKFWEPNAPSFSERKQALIYAYEKGFQTSISAEPMLDDQIGVLISICRLYVTDAIWLGKMNNARTRCKINGYGDPETMAHLDLIEKWQSDESILDLYEQYHDDPIIKWKESIKEIVGLKLATEKGMDI